MTDPIAAARSILARPQHHIMPEERIVATYILAAFPQVAKPSRDAVETARQLCEDLSFRYDDESIQIVAAAILAAEARVREECAVTCDKIAQSWWAKFKSGLDMRGEQSRSAAADECARAIRAGGGR